MKPPPAHGRGGRREEPLSRVDQKLIVPVTKTWRGGA